MKRGLVIWIIGTLLGYSAAMSAAVTYCAASSWGYAGTSVTGGGSATPTLVSSESALSTALNAGNKVIIITEDITVTNHISSSKSNMTIMALPGKKLISTQQNSSNSGILYLKGSNLILRNLTFEGPGAYDCDGWDNLCLDKATNVWVDHCDFQDGCDGNFDIKSTADNITVTWCRFRYLKAPRARECDLSTEACQKLTDDHRFTNLIGSSADDKPSDGTYNITYAYCWWDEGCKERMTRCRNASLHFLNCYWNSSVANYYIGPQNVDAYVEGCYIEGNPAKNKIFYQNYGGTNGVTFVNCYSAKGVPDNVTNRTVVIPSYSYTPSTAAEAKTAVTNSSCGAGATLTVTTGGAVSSTCDAPLPTHTVAVTTESSTKGTASAAETTVAEGQTTTITAIPNSGYAFDHWTVSGTGASLSSTTTNPTTLTMGTANVTITAYFKENTCPTSGTLYSAYTSATGNISIAESTSNLQLTTADHSTTVTGGSMSVYNGQTSAKNLITSSGFCATNNNTFFRIDLECELEAGDIISVDVGKDGSNERGVWISTANERPGSAPACALTATNASLVPVTYTVTGSDAYHGESTFYIYRATANNTYFNNINITRAVCENISITTQPTTPVDATVSSACSITGLVSAGTNPSYQWQTCNSDGSGGVDISDAGTMSFSGYNTATLVLTPIAAGTSYYKCVVSGSCGDPVISSVVTVNATGPSDAPTITAQPVGNTYCAGDGISALSVTATGSGTLSYQWKKDGVDIPSATSASYTPSESGTYTCVVTNTEDGKSATSLTSNNAVVTINAAIAAPTFSQTDNTVNMSSATAGATIYYTTDGTDPTTSSASGTSYTATTDCTIKAYAVKDGCSSSVASFNATYTPIIVYTVTYNANGGSVMPASVTQTSTGASVSLATPTRDGYTFLGWYVGATKIGDGGDSYIPTDDITAIAAWKQNCTSGGGGSETFDFNTGDAPGLTLTTNGSNASYNIVNATTNNIPVLDGYFLASSFTGNSSGVITITTDNSYSQIDSIEFNSASTDNNNPKIAICGVKVNGEDSTSLLSAIVLSSGSTKTWRNTPYKLDLHSLSPQYSGKIRFKLTTGSSNKHSGIDNIVIYYAGGSSGSCYYVTYDGNGADGGYTNDPAAYAADDVVTVLANSFTKSGTDVFKGWAATIAHRNAGTVDYLPGRTFAITSNTTLYAIWGPACTTPDAPTSPVKGATTTVSQEVSWTDAGNSLWEVYVSTSGTAPALDQTPTASPNSTSYTFTGLTPSTPYYWWVRSVCDASHKSAWVAGPNFTTATPTYTLTNEVSPAGYGTVTPASVADILLGTTSSSSSNTYTVGSTTVTATPAAATAQYTYAFDSWIGLPDEVTADATVMAKFSRTERTYSVTLNTNGGTINSGDVTEYTYGTGATLPTNVTRDGNYEFKGWYDNVGLTGSPVTTISTDATGDTVFWAKWISCPAANSGDIVYKFVVNSSVSDGNICSSGNNPRYLTTPTDLSTLIGGTLQGNITDNSNYGHLQFVSGRITYKNGSKGVLNIILDCPIQEGDLIRFNNYSSSNDKYNYLRHTSNSTTTDQIILNASKSETEIQQIVAPAGFAGKTELYIISGSNTTGISYFEIIRSCPLTLDAGTNGGTVGGAGTQVLRAAKGDEVALPHAFKDGYRFKGWFAAPSGGSAVNNPYTVTGATTLYAQFEDCPHDGTMYKFEVGTGLTDGAVTANGVAFDFNTSNYLTTMLGGTLTTDGDKASKVLIANNDAISMTDNGAYLKVDMDCALAEGDVFKSTISSNTAYVSKATSRTSTVVLPVGTLAETPIPASLVGEKTLYIWKGGGYPQISYFEITRPKRTNITLDATGAYNHYTTSVVATYGQAMPGIATLPLRTGYVFGGYYDAPNGAGTQYYNGLGYSVRDWDKDVITATLYAYWIEPCDIVPTLEVVVPIATIWDGKKVDMALVQLTCDFDTTGIHYSLVSASDAIAGCTFAYFDERIYIQGTPALGNASTIEKTITFTMTNDCSPASTYTATATIRIYPATQKAKIAYIVRGTKGGAFDAYNTSDESNSSALLTYLRGFYTVDCINGYATKDPTAIANFYKDYDLLIVTDFMETPEGYTNAIGTLIDKKPILSFEAYVAGKNGSNWHIGSDPKDPSPKAKIMKVLCAGHAIFQDAEGVEVFNKPGGVSDTTITVLTTASGKGLQGFVINEAPDFIFLATVRDENNKRDLIVSCERQIVFQARLLMYCINYNEMNNLSPAGKVVMHQMIDYLLMTDETKVADCSLVFDNGAGNTSFNAGTYSGTGTKGDGLWSTAANWAPGYNIVPTPFHPTRIIAECHVNNDDAHAGSVKVNKGRDEHNNPVDGKLIIEPEGGLTIAGVVQKVNDTRYASPITIKAEDLLIKADATHNGALVYGNKESDVNATVQYYSRGTDASSSNPVWQYIGIPFKANKTAIEMYYEAWMCRWEKASGLGGLWQWVENNDVLIPFEGYCITQEAAKTYTNSGKLNPPTTTTIVLDNQDDDGYAFAANSWTAPIKIQEMADEDFTNAEEAIYIYHTGSYANWESNGAPVSAVSPGSAATLPGQYAVIPIHSSPYLTGADSVIPSMQGFFVKTSSENAQLDLVYNRVVYDARYFKTSTQPMRIRSQVSEKPDVMVLLVCGATSGGDRVHLLSRSDFSDNFENGWDGRKIAGDSVAPMLSVVKEAGDMTVAAIPSMDNRYLSFRAGKDIEYTFSFDYEGEELYLYDIVAEKATRIQTGNTYSFSAINETPQQRFLITSNPPQLPTTIDNTLNDEIQAQQIEKFIRNDKLFILYRGEIYDALGKRVRISK